MNRIIFATGLLLGLIILAIALGDSWGNSTEIPKEVRAGFTVWQNYSCESCHTLYGQGGNYAPDLTHIYTLRGETYIREFIVDPAAFHPNQRVMPRFTITQTEISDLIVMLSWIANESSLGQNWPPNPIQVSGSGIGLNIAQLSPSESSAALEGRLIYSRLCASCHSIEPNVVLVGPSFWGLADRASTRFLDTEPEVYIRTSILYPSEYVVDGFQDVMQKNLAEVLSSNDIDAVIAFIMSLRESEGE
jgi:nitric oxide reductase subunit C